MAERQTQRLQPDERGVAEAAALLCAGRLVAFPTETVYGLGADATNGRAVAEIYAAKGRPSFNPLIVHLADRAAAERLARFDARAAALAEAFWPGPLTLVLPLRPDAPISDLVTAGLRTVGLRVPAAPAARALLAAADRPVAAPSANPSGAVSPTSAQHVLDGLAGRIDAVLDAGPCAVGLESTILKPEPDGVRLLRAGGAPRQDIERLLGAPLLDPTDRVEAPGALASHYAPGLRLRLDAEAPRPGEAWLGFGPDPAFAAPPPAARNLSPAADLTEAAAALFGALRALDAEMGGEGVLAVAPIPETGLGEAVADRLRRAAAPRP